MNLLIINEKWRSHQCLRSQSLLILLIRLGLLKKYICRQILFDIKNQQPIKRFLLSP